MLLCLYLGVNYLKGRDFFNSDKQYYALFEQTVGLQNAAPVLLKGVKIGSVTNISIDPARTDEVVVTVNIKQGFRIPTDSRLKLFTSGIMGARAIELVLGTADTYFEHKSVIPSESESGLLENASVSMGDIISEFKRIVNTLDMTATTVNGILEENAESLKGTINNLNSMTGQLADAQIGRIMTDLGQFSGMLRNNSERLDNIIANMDGVAGSLAEADFKTTVDGLNEGIGNLNSVLARVSAGEGTLGRLIENPALYDSLTIATGNLAVLLEDLKSNPRRYVHFSLFGGGNRDKKKDK